MGDTCEFLDCPRLFPNFYQTIRCIFLHHSRPAVDFATVGYVTDIGVFQHKSINSVDLAFTIPPDAQTWLVNDACLEADVFEYLLKIKDSSEAIGTILSKYVNGTLNGPPIEFHPSTMATASNREAAFICCMEAAASTTAKIQSMIEAVQRQESFMDKMHAQLWIRSPALESTLQRAIARYLKFLKLFKCHPKTMLVPTLDIDLVWHTHQCSPAQYKASTIQRVGRYINHNDKLGRPALDYGMETTRGLFRIRFGQEYVTCNCWDCELALSAISDRKQEDQTQIDLTSIRREVSKTVACYREVELARRARQLAPGLDK